MSRVLCETWDSTALSQRLCTGAGCPMSRVLRETWDSTAPSPEGPCPGLRKSATSIPPSRLSFRQPPPTQLFVRNARQQRFDIEKRRSIQHIDAANMQLDAVAAKQLHNSQPNRIRPPWRSRRKHSMRAIIRRRRTEQFESLRPVKLPEHDKMREAFNVSKPRPKLRQDFQNTLSLVLGSKPPGNLAWIFVRTTHKSNRPRGKHDEWCLRCSLSKKIAKHALSS